MFPGSVHVCPPLLKGGQGRELDLDKGDGDAVATVAALVLGLLSCAVAAAILWYLFRGLL